MRSARLNPSTGRLAVVLVAHGSRDPRAAASTEALARAVRRARPGWDVHASYLDHAGPRPLDVLTSLPGRRAVIVPLLLTEAYHGRVDVPAILTDAATLPVDVTLADVLGPTPSSPIRAVPEALLDGLVRRLDAAVPTGAASNGAEPGRAEPGVRVGRCRIGPCRVEPCRAGPCRAGCCRARRGRNPGCRRPRDDLVGR